MHRDGLEFHNVGELHPLSDRDGHLVQRVPEDVRTELEEAGTRMRHPAGVEIRFVPDGPATVTLSSDVRDSDVEVFWGPFQERDPVTVGSEPTTLEVAFPEKLADLDDEVVEELAFDPRVCRLRLPGEHRSGHVAYHGVDGDIRPPREAELPDRTYLAYGTSITEGEAARAEHLTYVGQTATRLDADLRNLGCCGTAYAEDAMAEYIAGQEWDVATLALSVNMVGVFDIETFRERAATMIETVAAANPAKPVVAITLYTHYRDYSPDQGDADLAREFRETLRSVVAESDRGNVHLLEGPEILDGPAGLTPDLVHPGDDAMIRMGQNLADRLEPFLED